VKERPIAARAGRTALAAALVAALCAPALLGPPSAGVALAGDDAVAKALFDSGKDAFAKRRYEDAVALFRRALAESGERLEAAYWQAQAHEKLGQTKDALAAYREFLALHKGATSLGQADKAHAALARKAEQAVEKLGAAERELDALNSGAVAKLLDFARARREVHPALARDALRRVLVLDPEHPEAAQLLSELGGPGSAEAPVGTPPPGPFERLAKGPWQDCIADRTFGTKSATYAGGLMTVDTKSGSILVPVERLRTGERFVAEADFRVTEAHETSWLVGFAVGWGKPEFYSTFAQRGQVVINRGHAQRGPVEDVDTHPMKPLDPRRWHRLGVRVEGRAMVVWFNGEVVVRTEVSDAQALQGDLALFVQRCKAEFRLLRVAPLE
jgi:tetratricopeptide (TPR) repeat protein